ncbi:(2Fe-2S) ferredoxin domain-containing protein [Methylobacterium sp. BTF04]|uniref:(2Fe-2S) ferredoxin domain-containing protein n=1 Tax=Methylobacterium sp. BTF04 TaxID=2708300 RepID=UPI001FEE2DC9|nr:(2Fe-2S) ferredoxin domain-containing protein [Methylobacterium sp. BTF04]
MARAGFSDVVLVCTKCAKRQGLKKGTLRGMLKRALKRGSGGRKTRVIEVGCLGPCPKRALAVATSASLAAHRIHLLDPALAPEAAAALLFPDFGPKGDPGSGMNETS